MKTLVGSILKRNAWTNSIKSVTHSAGINIDLQSEAICKNI